MLCALYWLVFQQREGQIHGYIKLEDGEILNTVYCLLENSVYTNISQVWEVLQERNLYLSLFFKDFIYLFIFTQRGREGEREGEKHQCVVASCALPMGDLARNPDMCLTGNRTSDPLAHRPVNQIHWTTEARAETHSFLNTFDHETFFCIDINWDSQRNADPEPLIINCNRIANK